VRGSCSAKQEGAVDPMIHRLWTWTTLITAPEAVVGLLLGSVSHGTPVDRCDKPYPITV
jgi:hypothetical protein